MKLRIGCVLVGFLLFGLSLAAQTSLSSAASAQVPPLIQFSNIATDEGGSTISGVVSITFSLYNSQQGGEVLWTETQNNVQLDSTGHYSVQLGITKPNGVPTTLFTSGEARWLGVRIAEQAEQPRVLLLSVPYALKAGDAATIGGLPPSAFVLAAPQNGTASAYTTESANAQSVSPATASDVTTTGGKADYVPVFNGASTVIDSKIYQKAGNVGIGNTSPKYGLDVGGHINSSAGYLIGDLTVLAIPGGPSSDNTAVGVGVLSNNTTGFSNTADGYTALSDNTTGYFNTASGYEALQRNTTENNNTASGNSALLNNTSGSFNTATGMWALEFNNGGANTASGYFALANNTTGINNTADGYYGLSNNTTGNYNTSSGYYALGDNLANNTGSYNTATGTSALQANTTGGANTASGAFALGVNNIGSDNTADGYDALSNNTTGNYNTASGYQALGNTTANNTGSYNTATGTSALQANTTGGANTATGAFALGVNNIGSDNTADGYGALAFNNTGYQNTALGAFALGGNSTGTNNIAIGYDAAVNVSGANSYNIEIGTTGTSTDNGVISIGTSGVQTSFFAQGIYGISSGNNSAIPVLVDSSGQLVTVSSSRRFKEDIQDMGEASSGLMRLRPVTFRYKKPLADGSQPIQYGLIAEEVAEVYPDLVSYSADGQIETVKYQLLDSMLLNEVQRQQAEIREQQAENRDQQNQIRDLQERLAKMEAALGAVDATPGCGATRSCATANATAQPKATVVGR
jgi:trimeric autotransporter adhesin